jgi:cytochrome c-type biogenesis protein CcmH/NrfG
MKPKILCAHCSAELHLGDKFCGSCGKPVEWSSEQSADSGQQPQESTRQASDSATCDTCGTVNKPNTDFCNTCGTDLRSQSKKPFQQKPAPSRQSKKEQRPTTTDPSPWLRSWKIIAGGVVIVGAIVGWELYNSQQIPTTLPAQQQQPVVPQEAMGANMAALPQIQEMEHQLSANPGNMGLTLQLANVLHDNRFYDKAITMYREYLLKNPKDTNARVDLGICYKEVGQLDAAKKEMKKALEYEPKHLLAQFNLGIVALIDGNLTESNDWFKKVVEMAPTSEVGKRAQQLLSQHSNPQILQPR